MDAEAILTAAEEVLRGTLGGVRTVTAGALLRDAYVGQTDEQLRMAVLVNARFEVEATSLQRTKAVGPVNASKAIHEIELRVRLAFSTESELGANDRRTVRADCLEMVETCRRALTWPGNLSATSASTATNLVGGALESKGPARVTREDWAARIFVTEALFSGLVNDTLPVS